MTLFRFFKRISEENTLMNFPIINKTYAYTRTGPSDAKSFRYPNRGNYQNSDTFFGLTQISLLLVGTVFCKIVLKPNEESKPLIKDKKLLQQWLIIL